MRVLSLLLAVFLCVPGDAGAEAPFSVVHNRHFVIRTDLPGPQRAHLAQRLDEFRQALETLLPQATGMAPFDVPIKVVVYEHAKGFSAHARRDAPALAHNGGYYDGRERRVVTYRRSNPLQVVFHEVAHAVIGDLFADPYYRRYARPNWPVWFDEGLAEHVSSYEALSTGLQFGSTHAARLATALDLIQQGAMVPLPELLRARTTQFTGPDKGLWYAAAWALVEHLLSEPTLQRKLHAWVARLRQGQDGYASFVATFGRDFKVIEAGVAGRLEALARRPLEPVDLLQGGLLDRWTQHEGGTWTLRSGVVEGRSATGWDYLTRSVQPRKAFSLSFDLRRDSGSAGLVLGSHGARVYPYHTLVEISETDVRVRASPTEDHLVSLLRRDGGAPAGRWTRMRLELDAGVLSLWQNGRHVFSVAIERPTVSLVGVYLRKGQGRFRDLQLITDVSRPGGPAASHPPRDR